MYLPFNLRISTSSDKEYRRIRLLCRPVVLSFEYFHPIAICFHIDRQCPRLWHQDEVAFLAVQEVIPAFAASLQCAGLILNLARIDCPEPPVKIDVDALMQVPQG